MSETKKKATGIKGIAVQRKDSYRLAPSDIHEKPGWNVRDLTTAEAREKLDELARSIVSAPGVLEPVTVYWEDGKAYLSNGHRRMAAVKIAIEKYGAEIKSVPVQIAPAANNAADHILDMIVRNSGEPITTFEMSKVVKQLVGFGWSAKEIADKIGKHPAYVNQMLGLQAAPEPIKRLVREGEVSATLAMKTMRTTDDAEQALQEAVERAKARGQRRATEKDVQKPSRSREEMSQHVDFIDKVVKDYIRVTASSEHMTEERVAAIAKSWSKIKEKVG